MLGTAIPGEGRWFQNSVVFGMKIVLTTVKQQSFVTILAKRTVKTKLNFFFQQEHFNSESSVFDKKTIKFFVSDV